ncbi:MAG: RNA polymerase sigma factor [Thermoleophilia bacterium]
MGRTERTPAAFEALWDAHFDAVLGYARRRSDPDAAPEAAAETFAVAWRRWDEVPDDPLPWLLGVCRRVIANQRRGEGRRRRLLARLAGLPPEVVPDMAEVRAEADAVRSAFLRLGARDRETLALVAWDGLTPAQAADVCGCSPGAFANRLHRARRRLAGELGRAAESSPAADPVLEDAP